MSSTEREVAFRKKRRDYTLHKPKNAIQANTTVIRVKQDKFIRAETILARTRQIKVDKKKYEVNLKRRASTNFPQPPENLNCALVVRLATKKENLCAETRKVLAEFHLNEQFDGCFVYLSAENRDKLKSVSHLITYGSPSVELVRQLIHTQASYMKDGKEVPITGNTVIRDALKEYKIICLDDIVNAINKGLESVSKVSEFLAPFHFTKTELAEKPKRPIHAGGSAGWRGEEITAFVESIN
ncbi:60S ribosomal protein L7-like 1 [Tritrichomonas foetus]|uniref:60S ribosomal protein L7-like 1 n=1 Tax=Tritrichomonas foetus TaxID=1144522 RepID=A0A1J4JRC2_9EUKA|nr:60S ribosomal protein L7-like 1 [Tritrichomonas foetus]|eukprot:OHT01711.1 60S ribosomal protein L7-like 1 [Tritrichomonas foetus]